MPPVLDPKQSKVDGLAFLGLSLSRKSKRGHPDSATHQQAFDLDTFQDRDYEYLFSTNDDGWLVGGGEPGPPTSYKLAAKDSAHVEIMRIGTYREEWGGLPQELIVETLRKGEILIPEITVAPTSVVANGDVPPELEIRFDMVPELPNYDDPNAPLPLNWQLRFLQNQLFHKFQFASRFTPGAFHSTILRKAEFRSEKARKEYFAKCQKICNKWMDRGAKPLAPTRDGVPASIEVVPCAKREPKKEEVDDESRAENEEESLGLQDYYRSGLWLFTDRNNISHQFLPNFLPPYDTPIKRQLILAVLKEQWDETTLSWTSHTSRFDPIPTFLKPLTKPKQEEEEEPTVPQQKMLAVSPPKADKKNKSISAQQASRLSILDNSILDPNDDAGFTYFVSSFGTEMANMTAEVCAPLLHRIDNGDGDQVEDELGTNSSLISANNKTGGATSTSMEYEEEEDQPKVVVTGQRVSKSRRPVEY